MASQELWFGQRIPPAEQQQQQQHCLPQQSRTTVSFHPLLSWNLGGIYNTTESQFLWCYDEGSPLNRPFSGSVYWTLTSQVRSEL